MKIYLKLNDYKISNRIRLDQSFNKNTPTVYRFRYKPSLSFFLTKKKRIKFATELLYTYSLEEKDIGIRTIPSYLITINKRNNLEIGIDYRVNSFLYNNKENINSWLFINWSISQ